MPFHLKRVLKAWLLSTSQPLSLRDIQAAFSRYHEQVEWEKKTDEDAPPLPGAEPNETASESATAALDPEVLLPIPDPFEDAELYQDVPSLITAAQIREAMDEIARDLKLADEGLLLIEGANGYRLATHPRFGRWIRILRQEPPPVKLSQSSLETLAVVAYRQPSTRGEIETIRGVSAEAGLNKLIERELVAIVGRADLPGRPIQYGTTDRFLEFVGLKSLDELPASDVLSSRQIDEWLRTSQSPKTPGDREMGLDEEEGVLPEEAKAKANGPDAAAGEN